MNTQYNGVGGKRRGGVSEQGHYQSWDTKSLIEHVINVHHANIRKILPEVLRSGAVISYSEGVRYPATKEIYGLLLQFDRTIRQHLTSLEYALFPYILETENVYLSKLPFVAPEFGRVEKPIRAIESQHRECMEMLKEIHGLSGGFVAPPDASLEHQKWYAMLKELYDDMMLHFHLECDILFPRAIEQESMLLERRGFTTIWMG